MNVKELREKLAEYPDEMEVVARYPHCCGRHAIYGGDDDFRGATEDAWWVPELGVVRVGGMDPEEMKLLPLREVLGIGGMYPEKDDKTKWPFRVSGPQMARHRRHEVGDYQVERYEKQRAGIDTTEEDEAAREEAMKSLLGKTEDEWLNGKEDKD